MAYQTRRMTEDEVFAVLLCCMRAESESIDCSLEDRARVFVDCIDLPGALTLHPLTGFLGALFDVRIPYETWQRVLAMGSSATMRDLCRLIAAETRVPVLSEAVILGRRCLPAGAFRICRDLLIEGGESADRLAPSTSITDLKPAAVSHLFWTLGRLSPGLVDTYGPGATVRDGLLFIGAAVGLTAALLTVPLGIAAASWPLVLTGLAFASLTTACCWRSWSYFAAPKTLRFRQRYTLKELARAWTSDVASKGVQSA